MLGWMGWNSFHYLVFSECVHGLAKMKVPALTNLVLGVCVLLLVLADGMWTADAAGAVATAGGVGGDGSAGDRVGPGDDGGSGRKRSASARSSKQVREWADDEEMSEEDEDGGDGEVGAPPDDGLVEPRLGRVRRVSMALPRACKPMKHCRTMLLEFLHFMSALGDSVLTKSGGMHLGFLHGLYLSRSAFVPLLQERVIEQE
jgi:hypothetical protein